MALINTSEDNINSIADDREGQPPKNRNLESIIVNRNLCKYLCQSLPKVIFSIIITIILILQIYIGWRYSDACPIGPLISYYLIIGGIVSLALVLLISIIRIMTRTLVRTMSTDTIDRENPNRRTMPAGCGVCSLMCINFSLFLFLIGWTVVGWIWVIEVWHRVQYRQVERNDYCHPLLYQFSFSILLLTTTFKMAFLCFVRRRTSNEAKRHERKDSLASDEV